MQLEEYEFERISCYGCHLFFCAWCPGMKEGSWPTLSLCMCLSLPCLRELCKKIRMPGIVYLCSPLPLMWSLCDPLWSLCHHVWYGERTQQKLRHNTHSCPANACKLLLAFNFQFLSSQTIIRIDIKRVWRQLGFQCLLSSNDAFHMPKPGVEIASKSRSLADMTLREATWHKNESEHQEIKHLV